MKVEYQVRRADRYFVTRYADDGKQAGSSTKGEYDNPSVAYEVAYALCRAEHERLGYPPGDERIQYPLHPGLELKVTHASDCAIHAPPAYVAGACDCGAGKRLSDKSNEG